MTKRTLIYFLFLLAGVTIGAVARDGIVGDPASERTAATDSEQPARAVSVSADLDRVRDGDSVAVFDMLESLSFALTQEAEYRQAMEEEIAALSDRVEELQAQLSELPAAPNLDAQRAAKMRRDARGGALTVDSLMAAGLNDAEARNVKRRVDDIAMQRLYLRDQAMREGWLGGERYREEARALAQAQNNLSSEFGDEVFDRYLFAAGRPNRVQIQSVIGESPAAAAGLQQGDRIVSYNGERTWAPGDLRRASQQGNAGEMVPVEIWRNGQPVTLYIPRGPLGIQMTGTSEKP